MAGSTTTQSIKSAELETVRASIVQVQIDLLADDADGSFLETTVTDVGGNLISVYVDPGGTAPTTAVDLTVELGTTGIDLLGGAGADIATAADALITPLIGAISAPAGFADDLLVKLINNSVNSATITIYLIIAP